MAGVGVGVGGGRWVVGLDRYPFCFYVFYQKKYKSDDFIDIMTIHRAK